MRSDLKGFLFGLSLGLAAVAGFGAAQIDRDMIGHYQIAAAGDSRNPCVYVIDTNRGDVWERKGDGFVRFGSPFDER